MSNSRAQKKPRQIIFLIYLFIYYVLEERETREHILTLLSRCEKSRFSVKTAPLGFFSGFGSRFVYIGDVIPCVSFSGCDCRFNGASGAWISSLRS